MSVSSAPSLPSPPEFSDVSHWKNHLEAESVRRLENLRVAEKYDNEFVELQRDLLLLMTNSPMSRRWHEYEVISTQKTHENPKFFLSGEVDDDDYYNVEELEQTDPQKTNLSSESKGADWSRVPLSPGNDVEAEYRGS